MIASKLALRTSARRKATRRQADGSKGVIGHYRPVCSSFFIEATLSFAISKLEQTCPKSSSFPSGQMVDIACLKFSTHSAQKQMFLGTLHNCYTANFCSPTLDGRQGGCSRHETSTPPPSIWGRARTDKNIARRPR